MTPRPPTRGRFVRRLAVWAGGLLLAVTVAAVLFLDAAAGRIAAAAASKALGTEVRISSVHIGVFDGISTVSGIDVREPPGFPEGSMLEVDGVRVNFGLSEVFAKSIEVESVEIRGVRLQLAEAGGSLNINTIAKKLSEGDAAEAQAQAAPSRPVVVRRLTMQDIRVTASSTMTTLAGKSIDATIPDIVIEDIGTHTTVADVASAVSTEIIARLTAAVVAARIQGLSSECVSQLGSAVQTLGGAAKSLLEGVGPALEGAGKKIGEALDGLLNPK